tara:strand:+ start:558 stop:725 length:168 start_codon:yes stop_codon:yes gene_type:complete
MYDKKIRDLEVGESIEFENSSNEVTRIKKVPFGFILTEIDRNGVHVFFIKDQELN